MENKKLNKRRISRFALVGIFNTAFDFGILNTLVFVFGLPNVGANVISGSVAACVSFFLNQRFVFKADKNKSGRQFIIFIIITAVGLYGLQNLIIYSLTNYLTAPSSWCYELLELIKSGMFSKEFVRLNFAKGVATIASLIWNYVLYGRYVFKQRSESF